MSQSTIITAFLGAAFLIFITQRGELRTYLGFLFGNVSGGTGAQTADSGGGVGGGGDRGADYAQYLETGAEILAAV